MKKYLILFFVITGQLCFSQSKYVFNYTTKDISINCVLYNDIDSIINEIQIKNISNKTIIIPLNNMPLMTYYSEKSDTNYIYTYFGAIRPLENLPNEHFRMKNYIELKPNAHYDTTLRLRNLIYLKLYYVFQIDYMSLKKSKKIYYNDYIKHYSQLKVVLPI